MLDIDSLECEGHVFERIQLKRVGEHWLAQFAIDNVKYAPFYEPIANTYGMKEQEFLRYIQAQALTMVSYLPEAA